MEDTHKKYEIEKKCEYCGIIHKGVQHILDNGSLVKSIKIENSCDCSEEKIIKQIKPDCFICGTKIHPRPKTTKQLIRYFIANGNTCPYCSARAGRAFQFTKKNRDL